MMNEYINVVSMQQNICQNKRNEALLYGTTTKDIEKIMLNEKIQSEGNTCCVFPFT